jgi:hypothetical protein
MKEFVVNMINDFGPIEWLLVWLLLFAPPVIAFYISMKGFRAKENRLATMSLIIGMILTGLLTWLLWSIGAQMVQMTVTSAGIFVIGILIAAAVCLVAFPIGLVGSQLRAAFEYRRRGSWVERGRKSFLIGLSGLLVLAVLIATIYQNGSFMAASIFGVITLSILVLGWFRRFLVPDVD